LRVRHKRHHIWVNATYFDYSKSKTKSRRTVGIARMQVTQILIF